MYLVGLFRALYFYLNFEVFHLKGVCRINTTVAFSNVVCLCHAMGLASDSGVGGGGLLCINHAWMCVSKSEGYGSLFGLK